MRLWGSHPKKVTKKKKNAKAFSIGWCLSSSQPFIKFASWQHFPILILVVKRLSLLISVILSSTPSIPSVSLVNKAVVDYFFVELGVERHFEALRHFLLMEDGEFAQSLSDLLFEKVKCCCHLSHSKECHIFFSFFSLINSRPGTRFLKEDPNGLRRSHF